MHNITTPVGQIKWSEWAKPRLIRTFGDTAQQA
jgi:hypothetical protein